MLENVFQKISQLRLEDYNNYLRDNLIILRYWDKSTNFGDYMNPFIVKNVLKKPVVSSYKFLNFFKKPELLGMGSIIGGDMSKCVIWGSGIISPTKKIDAKPIKVLHVRGKKTQQVLEKYGISTPSLYGDPAFLLPEIYSPKQEKKYKLGIIPHYCEVDLDIIKEIKKRNFDDILIINPLDPFKDILDAINRCESIASSSLHGLIVAEAYNIPTLRLHLSNIIQGGDFKFEDHYSGLNIDNHKKFYLEDIKELGSVSFFKLFTQKEIIIEKQELMENLRENFA